MKINFKGLNKSTFINALYEYKRSILEEQGIIKPELTKKHFESIEYYSGVKSLNGVPMNIHFRNGFVEFDPHDDLPTILNILLMMKIDSNTLYDHVKDDLILEFQYKQLVKEIAEYELEMDETQKDIFCWELALKRYKRMVELKNPKLTEGQVYHALKRKDELTKKLSDLMDKRLFTLVQLFELEPENEVYVMNNR